MSDPIVAWRTEHEYFRRLLALLHGQLDVFQRGERPDYELMLDVIGYLREYGDAFHHPREDVALARLKQEHRVIERAGERLAALLNQALDGAMVARVEIEIAAATYLVYYGNHIAKEDETVLVLAERAMTPQDWEAVKQVAAPRDPLFGGAPHERYRALARRLAS